MLDTRSHQTTNNKKVLHPTNQRSHMYVTTNKGESD
uniref:Uncharacterized protein n=1 Tax=Rhizophora mucronata TaxID=61149 RepID=A0A2P2NUM1_RHIMU